LSDRFSAETYIKSLAVLIIVLIMLEAVTGCTAAVSSPIESASPKSESFNESSPSKSTAETAMVVPTTEQSLVEHTPEATTSQTTRPVIKTTPPQPTAKATLTEHTTVESSQAASKDVLAEGFYAVELDDNVKARITGMSYPADDSNSAIHYADLRYLRILHYDFAGAVHEGELIVHRSLADEVLTIFYELYKAKYSLTSVNLVDNYGEPGDDNVSMAANNTSAFNYRFVTGTRTLSRHSYGAAVDINPMLNPYLVGDRIAPENGAEYADRSRDFAGKIDHDDLCYQLFIAHGWSWGGDWNVDKDYQHFSKKIVS
jgi:hypothetical protein